MLCPSLHIYFLLAFNDPSISMLLNLHWRRMDMEMVKICVSFFLHKYFL